MSHVSDDPATRFPYTHRIPLDPPVPQVHSGELSKRIFFVSEAIKDFSLVECRDRILAVDLALQEHVDLAELSRKLHFVVVNDVLGQRPMDPKVIWRRAESRAPRDVYPELVARGIAREAGEGQIAVEEPILSLMDHLDFRIRALIMADAGAREHRYPTVIPTTVLKRCGYLQSFPQLLMFVSRLHGDVDTYRQFLDDMADGGDVTGLLRSHCDNYDYCLPPTMCFHTYHQLADQPLPSPSAVVTSRGKSFRFESRYRRSLERLWDFTIREVVFLGSRDFVLRSRSALMDRTFNLATELGLGGYCEVATDPFFASADTAERVWSQQFLELKYELRLPLEPGRDVAVCSFNFHDQFFGKSFAIGAADGDEPVYTACAGYGLERFAYAFLCQHGLDPAGWPGGVREAITW